MTRLSDGRVSMLWNTTPVAAGADIYGSREELSIAFSDDDAQTWSRPVVVAARYFKEGDPWVNNQVSYPYLCEVKPGVFWITSMFGGLRMIINAKDIIIPEGEDEAKKKRIVLFGDSTTAHRGGVVVYAQLLQNAVRENQWGASILNSSVPSSTTAGARDNFQGRGLNLRPDLVVIQFGMNDSAIDVWKNPPATTPRVSEAKYEENLRWMIGQLKEKKIPVILMTANPMSWNDKLKELYGKPPYNPADPKSFTDTTLRRYSEIVRNIAKSENVTLIDVLQKYDDYSKQDFEKVNDWLLDGMHPNSQGHKMIHELLLPQIEKKIEFPRVDVKNKLVAEHFSPTTAGG